MIISNVRYVVKAEYAAENQEHIRQVTENLRRLQRTDITYSVFMAEDGKTFVHWLICANEEARNVFVQQPAFKTFQAALAASQPEVAPAATSLMLVDSNSHLLS